MNLTENYYKTPNDIFDLNLDPYEFSVLSLLIRYENNNEYSFPSYNTISEKCHISRRKAITTIESLVNKDYISKQVTRIDKHNNKSNRYVVHVMHHLVNDMHQGSEQDAPYKEVLNKELCIKNNILHQTEFDDLLNDYSLKRFNRPLRKSNKVIDTNVIEDMDSEMFIEFLDDNIQNYDQCNYDYIEKIQDRAR